MPTYLELVRRRRVFNPRHLHNVVEVGAGLAPTLGPTMPPTPHLHNAWDSQWGPYRAPVGALGVIIRVLAGAFIRALAWPPKA